MRNNDWVWLPPPDATPSQILRKCADLLGIVETVLSGDDCGEGIVLSGEMTGGLLDIVKTARIGIEDVSNTADRCNCGSEKEVMP